MSFSTSAEKIRHSLKKYTKNSIIHGEIRRLSKPTSESVEETKKMPWLSFLLIEWLYQVEEASDAIDATDKDLYNILNSMYKLQNEASNFKDSVNIYLALRRMLLGQLWCQLTPLHHHFTLIRLYSLMIIDGKTPYFEKTFKKITEIELFDFFQLSLWLSFASVHQKGIIKYEQILKEFYPKYTTHYLAKILKLVSGGSAKLREVMSTVKTPKISPERYFASPKLLDVPFFKFEDRLGSLHSSVTCKGLAEFVLNIFKTNDHEKFRNHFSRHFEAYVGIVIDESKLTYINESNIETIYKANGLKGKVIDFLLTEINSSIFIDAKAIEPPAKIMVSDNPKIIRQRLKGSFTKGIEQSFECAKLLIGCKEVQLSKRENRFVIVVTHQDFYLSSGASLREHISNDFFSDLIAKYGDHIPIENVHFFSIEDFEGIMLMCSDHSIELPEFLRFCSAQDSQPQTRKFDIRQHLQSFMTEKEIVKNSPIGTNYLLKRKDELFEALKETLRSNSEYWKVHGTNVIPEYLNKFSELKELVR